MAESTKILSPNKKVIFPTPNATCPMASMITKEDVLRLKENHPNAKVVCYINSTAEVKSVVDVCCTSSNAIEIVKNLESDEIIFLPDKEFYMLDMCCSNMKKNSIKEIYKCLKNHSNEITIDENIREKVAKSLEKMHRLGV